MRNKLICIAAGILFLTGCFLRPMMELTYEQAEQEEEYELKYVFQNPEGVYLSTLREDYDLMAKTVDLENDLERAAVLSQWVHMLWEHDPKTAPTKQDPLTILWEAEEGHAFRGVEYATVLNGALQALAIPARFINLHGKDIEKSFDSHVVVEAYLRDKQKWVMVDPRWNRIPMYEGEPLNAYELQKMMSIDPRGITYYQESRDRTYSRWIQEYLYYIHTNQDCRLNTEVYTFKNLMLVPKNLPTPRYYSPYHEAQGFELSLNTSITHEPDYFYGTPQMLFEGEDEFGEPYSLEESLGF